MNINDWVVRVRVPDDGEMHTVILLLHGWTGDENAMWVFASRLPRKCMLIAPRGPYLTPLGGYGWHPYRSKAWPWVDDFRPTVDALNELLQQKNFLQAEFSNFHIVGFSQGAALAYTFLSLNPEKVQTVAGLSGFLPDGYQEQVIDHPLRGKNIFSAHGTQDELVPVDRARKGIDLLQEAGADVTYCEDNVGHKLSASCFRGLELFYSKYI
jgi:phospholipase/carboxylesterase